MTPLSWRARRRVSCALAGPSSGGTALGYAFGAMSDFYKTLRARVRHTSAMQYIDKNKLIEAEQCVWQSARVLERVRFEHLFRAGPSAPIVQALGAYQKSDGGFGHGIEPDFRGPISQPLNSDFALRVLAELPEPDAGLLRDTLRYLKSITVADGGVPNTLPSVRDYPRAPWWQAEGDTPPGNLLPTAGILGHLYLFKVDDPWLATAAEFSWRGIARLIERAPQAQERLARLFVAYEARSAMTFLDHVPERARAERVAGELGQALLAAKLVQIEVDAAGEAAQPLEYAPTPDSLAARWLDRTLFDAHLDAWVNAQAEHGGWNVPWMIWTPVTEHEWRGIQTIERLKTLRAWGRFKL